MADGTRAVRMTELVEQFGELLYRYAYRLTGNATDAEDLTQQTFLRAQQKCHQLRDLSAARWWLCSIMRNSFLTSRRHSGVMKSLEGIDESELVDLPPEAIVAPEELQRALLELSEEFRSPLIMYYFDEFSYQEIADQMGVPIGTVMSRLSRGKAFLRRHLSEKLALGERLQGENPPRTVRTEVPVQGKNGTDHSFAVRFQEVIT
jgi:RNA polymerase sigma-70 factor (ECF subfamily)